MQRQERQPATDEPLGLERPTLAAAVRDGLQGPSQRLQGRARLSQALAQKDVDPAGARLPVVVTLGGGYADPIARTAEAHANTFRVAAEVFGDA